MKIFLRSRYNQLKKFVLPVTLQYVAWTDQINKNLFKPKAYIKFQENDVMLQFSKTATNLNFDPHTHSAPPPKNVPYKVFTKHDLYTNGQEYMNIPPAITVAITALWPVVQSWVKASPGLNFN